jgi:hypothetical protein
MDTALDLIKELLENGTFFPSALEANHGVDLEEWEEKAKLLIETEESKSQVVIVGAARLLNHQGIIDEIKVKIDLEG